ncbi:MAG: nucleotidyltransferase substrate binding protein [Ignavibacteriaceae bacterium]
MNKNNIDIRWIQRFANFQAALSQLQDGITVFNERGLSLLEKQGIIKAFEFTHELAWNVLKDYFDYQGNFSIKGSRDAIREAFKYNLIHDANLWMKMIETRNLTAHTYDKETADEIVLQVVNVYAREFSELKATFLKIENEFKQ